MEHCCLLKIFDMKNFFLYAFILVALVSNTNAQTIITVAGTGLQGFSGDGGLATDASFYYPAGVCADDTGNIYIADKWNHRIRKVNANTGVVNTIAGNGTGGFEGDNGLADTAELFYPSGICIDSNNNLYIADEFNARVRKIEATTGIITTVAGKGAGTALGDGGPATNATVGCEGVFITPLGNLYIADAANSLVRKVDLSTGIIVSVAGNGVAAYAGDGGAATNASLNEPWGVFIDAAENIYIADRLNNRVRKVSHATGLISTIAGTGIAGFAGDGGLAINAEINSPKNVLIDPSGNIYIVDDLNNRIRKIDAITGYISTIAGGGTGGDNIPATDASLFQPQSICFDGSGSVFIAENQKVRKVSGLIPNAINNLVVLHSPVTVIPNPTISQLTITSPIRINQISISNLLGQTVGSYDCNSVKVQIDVSNFPLGIYLIKINGLANSRFVKE